MCGAVLHHRVGDAGEGTLTNGAIEKARIDNKALELASHLAVRTLTARDLVIESDHGAAAPPVVSTVDDTVNVYVTQAAAELVEGVWT